MRTNLFSRNHWKTLSLIVLTCLFTCDLAWAQPGGNDDRRRGGRRRGDPTSFLTAYRDQSFTPSLKLTEDQSKQLEEFRRESIDLRRKFENSPDEYAAARKELDEKAIHLLTDEQKATWQKRLEEIKAEQAKANADSADQRPAAAPPKNGTPAVPIGPETAVQTPQAETKRTVFEEKPPEGAITIISFGATVPASADKPEVVKEAVKDASAVTPIKEQPKLSFNFRYAAWADVLKLFADVNDLSLDLNEVPPGTFNYWDDQQYTMTEALDILNGYLLMKGYVLVRRDRFLVCLNIADPIPPNVVPNVTAEELLQRGKNELLSLILPLEGVDATSMVTEVSALLGPQGKASALKSTNSLVLTDIGSNLRRVVELLKASKPIDNRETAFRAIPLTHITAAEAERTVRRLFGLNPTVSTAAQPAPGQFPGRGGGGWPGGFGREGFRGRGGDGGDGNGAPNQPAAPAAPTAANPPSPFTGKIQVAADTRLNILLVTASAPLLKVVEELVTKLDTNTDASGRLLEVRNNPVYFEAYSVAGGDSAAMSRMLNNVIPGVVVGDDARAGKIFVQGTKEDHTEIQRLLKASGDASSSVAVIPLRSDPLMVQSSLKNLFANDATKAPSIEADVNGRRLLVRGTAEQLIQVKALLRDLGEHGFGEAADGERDLSTSRTLNLGNHDPDEILKLVERSWGAAGHSPIRVVIPSRNNPIKDRRVPGARPQFSDPNADEGTPVRPSRRAPARSENGKSTGTEFRRGGNGPSGIEVERAPNPPATPRSATTRILPRRLTVVPATQTTVEEASEPAAEKRDSRAVNDDQPEVKPAAATLDQSVTDQSVPVEKNEANHPLADQSKAADNPDAIGVTVLGNELVLTSPDTKALDQLEALITAVITAIPQRPQWTVFYLRTADATEAAQMIERLFPQSSVTTTPVGNDNSFFGGFSSGFSGFGRSMMNATGLTQTLGTAQNLRIITDVRSNALFVTGAPAVVQDVEAMLELLDASEVPGTMRDRFPRTIPVEYADVDEVAEIIESVFKDSMTAEPQQQGNQQFNPLAMMFGGNRGAQQQGAKKPQGAELSLGVDKRTSHLIVSCNEVMFQRVELMVQAIDERAKEAHRTVRIVPLKTADPAVVQSTLTSLLPRVTVGATRSKRTTKPDGTNPTPGQNVAPDATRDPRMIQRMMEQNGGQSGGGRFGGRGGSGGNGQNSGGRRGN
ncbi:secretin N-terminal domain-containing protein [Schlesneria paludicola]|uniref:secretin N-terminal domain-containing protein n=1 Tax=Schlesneria paludicola TaxID=360056 RepID=UPI00029A8FCB|nr:secretin N-terminal domain-containing protein [Schlesneria paludicola]